MGSKSFQCGKGGTSKLHASENGEGDGRVMDQVSASDHNVKDGSSERYTMIKM